MADEKVKALTQKQRRFIEEYVADGTSSTGNAVQAYFRAFGRVTLKGKRRSYKGAQAQSSLLLSNPIIASEVAAAQKEYADRIRVSKARVLAETACVAFADVADAFDRDPQGGPLVAKALHDIPAATRRAIQSVKFKRRRLKGDPGEVYEVEEVEYKFASKMDALDKLSKKLGFYADPADKPKTDGVPVELLTRLLALAGANGGGTGTTPAGDAVESEPRPPEPGVPQPG